MSLRRLCSSLMPQLRSVKPWQAWSSRQLPIGLRSRAYHSTAAHAAAAMAPPSTDLVNAELARNRTLWVTLNRPNALHAANEEMVSAMISQLRHALTLQPRPAAVVLSSTTPKAFCSGGDIKAARQAALETPYQDVPPPGHFVHDIFQAEYQLICLLAKYPLPIISLCQGVWMGFSVGLAAFGSHRVVTPATKFAMPENHIGLWPDVGFGLLATQAPSATGLCLALSGYRCDAPSDLVGAGLATHLLASEDSMQALKQELQEAPLSSPEAIDSLLQRHCGASTSGGAGSSGGAPAYLTECRQDVVERVFGPALLEEDGEGLGKALQGVVQRLQQVQEEHAGQLPAEFATLLLERITAGCPTSLAVTLRHYRAVHQLASGAGEADRHARLAALVDRVMQVEFGLAVRLVGRHNFIEGVRAVVVDKDRNPRWQPASLAEVDDAEVAALFAPLPEGVGLQLPSV